jgi:hypothetical protein
MLKRIIISVAMTVAVLLLVDLATSSVISCKFNQLTQNKGQQDKAHLNSRKDCLVFDGVVSQGLSLISSFFPSSAEVWTAAATVVIAVLGLFTISVARSTKISADALTQSERAHVFIKVIDHNLGDGLNPRTPEPITVEFIFKNHGKTPAILREISRDIAYWQSPPSTIDYIPVGGLPAEKDRIIDPDCETGSLKCQNTDMTAKNAQAIIRGQKYVWFYGRAVYDDIFGARHEHRFIYQRTSRGEFRAISHPQHSKNT